MSANRTAFLAVRIVHEPAFSITIVATFACVNGFHAGSQGGSEDSPSRSKELEDAVMQWTRSNA
jgi:hypothetical protein